jgi:uncharacterized protein (DUF111 family)
VEVSMPATLALLEGAHVVRTGVPDETLRPTGAALLEALGGWQRVRRLVSQTGEDFVCAFSSHV